MLLMSEAMTNLCTIAGPIVLAIITFIVALARFISFLAKIWEKSNLENIVDNIKAEKETIGVHLDEVAQALKQVSLENAELKKQNKELKEALLKIKE